MEKIFHWTNTFKSLGEDDDGGVKIRGLASTNALDRQGDTINHDAWIKKGGLNNYQQNPIILFNHVCIFYIIGVKTPFEHALSDGEVQYSIFY